MKTFNPTNSNIDWAKWSWNPITGCLHNCEYCYAPDIANRYRNNFPNGFEPTLHEDRLQAPSNTRLPRNITGIGDKTVFVCSMADLLGDWVPVEWINKVLDVIKDNPQWNYILLTKNPKRLIEFSPFPDHVWVGTTVDTQARVSAAEEAFSEIDAAVKFVSVEPFLAKIEFVKPELFDWLIIGGLSRKGSAKAWQPNIEWVESLVDQFSKAGAKIYMKPNLSIIPDSEKIKEYSQF